MSHLTDSARRRLRRAAAPALAALLVAAGLPSAAGAAEVTEPFAGRIEVTAAPGELNRIRIADDGPGFVTIRDQVALHDGTRVCREVTSVELRCAVEGSPRIAVRLGDGADRLEAATTLRLLVDGAEGNDTYAGRLAGPTNVLFLGGPDFDTASYADATAGVTVRVGDGQRDGRAVDQDDIRAAERIIGSRFGDQLDASTAEPAIDATLDGGSGNDILTGAGGRDELVGGLGIDFLSGRGGVDRVVASDGDRDTIDCGPDVPDEALVSLAGESSITACERVLAVRTATTTQPGAPIGTLRLHPKALEASVGEPTRLRMSWRHPRAWKQLRTVELRLTARGRPVGRITIHARSERISADGAVRMVSRATRLAHRGKTVTARLALRLDASLAGQTLRADVEATDRRGRRQLELGAATVRVGS
jgi:hemolysin type calcium-binding protein